MLIADRKYMNADWSEQLENLRKWLLPKIQWTLIMLGMLGITYAAITIIQQAFSSSSSPTPGYLYKTPPEKCYCSKCGAEIDMRKFGLYGKHCREIEKCPVCGAGGHPLWRRKWW